MKKDLIKEIENSLWFNELVVLDIDVKDFCKRVYPFRDSLRRIKNIALVCDVVPKTPLKEDIRRMFCFNFNEVGNLMRELYIVFDILNNTKSDKESFSLIRKDGKHLSFFITESKVIGFPYIEQWWLRTSLLYEYYTSCYYKRRKTYKWISGFVTKVVKFLLGNLFRLSSFIFVK